MKMLAIEFSGQRRSVAVADGRQILGKAEIVETRETPSLRLVDSALQQAGWEREAIERILVGLGPGSYTGIRNSLALAQGWKLGRNVDVVGLNSNAALVEQAWTEGRRGMLRTVVDAQRGEFYLADYVLDANGWREVRPLRIGSRAELGEVAGSEFHLVGPDPVVGTPHVQPMSPFAETLIRIMEHPAARRPDLEPIYLRETAFVKAPALRNVPEAKG